MLLLRYRPIFNKEDNNCVRVFKISKIKYEGAGIEESTGV